MKKALHLGCIAILTALTAQPFDAVGQTSNSSAAQIGPATSSVVGNLTERQRTDASQTLAIIRSRQEGQKQDFEAKLNNIPAISRGQKLERGRVGSEIAALEKTIEATDAAIDVLGGRQFVNADILLLVEEVLQAVTRPIWVVCNGRPWIGRDEEGWKPFIEEFMQRNGAMLESVARVEVTQVTGNREIYLGSRGTSFLIGSREVLTNRHVLSTFAWVREGKWEIHPSRRVKVNFGAEYADCPQRAPDTRTGIVSVERVGAGEDDDWAVLRLETDVDRKPLGFSATPVARSGNRMALVGFPGEPKYAVNKMTVQDLARVFGAPDGKEPQYEIKRIGPGTLMEGTDWKAQLVYNANSFSGSSGSAVVRLNDGAVIGLHFGAYVSGEAGGTGYNRGIGGGQLASALSPSLLPHVASAPTPPAQISGASGTTEASTQPHAAAPQKCESIWNASMATKTIRIDLPSGGGSGADFAVPALTINQSDDIRFASDPRVESFEIQGNVASFSDKRLDGSAVVRGVHWSTPLARYAGISPAQIDVRPDIFGAQNSSGYLGDVTLTAPTRVRVKTCL